MGEGDESSLAESGFESRFLGSLQMLVDESLRSLLAELKPLLLLVRLVLLLLPVGVRLVLGRGPGV